MFEYRHFVCTITLALLMLSKTSILRIRYNAKGNALVESGNKKQDVGVLMCYTEENQPTLSKIKNLLMEITLCDLQ